MLRVTLLVVGVVTGLFAGWLALQMRTPTPISVVQAAPAAPTPLPMQDVLVASADLQPAQVLSSETMHWQPWPVAALSPAYITRSGRPDALETITGSIIRNRMSVGEPIRAENTASTLSAMLPPGKRAVAVRISVESTAGGKIRQNDQVDVLHTEGQEHVSSTVLTNIPVLVIDDKTATLELDPQQAEVVAAAQASGTLSLSLRSLADNGDNSRPASHVVRVIRAGQVRVVNPQ